MIFPNHTEVSFGPIGWISRKNIANVQRRKTTVKSRDNKKDLRAVFFIIAPPIICFNKIIGQAKPDNKKRYVTRAILLVSFKFYKQGYLDN